MLMTRNESELVAVLFMDGIYKEHQGKIYRHTLTEYPNKKHHSSGFLSLQDILDSRDGAKPIFEGDSITVQF